MSSHAWRGDFFSIAQSEMCAKVNALSTLCSSGRLQSRTEAELHALLPSVLDRAFKGEL